MTMKKTAAKSTTVRKPSERDLTPQQKRELEAVKKYGLKGAMKPNITIRRNGKTTKYFTGA